jgi:nucleoid DNA-binding protein
MTKAELIERLHASKEFKNAVSKRMLGTLIDAVFDEVRRSIRKEGKFSYPDFGTFQRVLRSGRIGRNPKTQEPIKIPRRRSVSFRPHKAFKELLNPQAR